MSAAVLDASILVYWVDPYAPAPIDPQTGKPVSHCSVRIMHLISRLQSDGTKIIVPTPALAEVLVKAQAAAPGWLAEFKRTKHIRVVAFDERAAVEHAMRQEARLLSNRRSKARPKAKFDDQILAIAAVEGVDTIYSDDGDIRKDAPSSMQVLGIGDLPIPKKEPQLMLELSPSQPEKASPMEDAAAPQ
jgi:hypothetical protein